MERSLSRSAEAAQEPKGTVTGYGRGHQPDPLEHDGPGGDNRRQLAKGRPPWAIQISRHGCVMFPKKKQRKKQTVLAQIREQHKEAKASNEPPPPPSERYPDPEIVDEVMSKSRKIARARCRGGSSVEILFERYKLRHSFVLKTLWNDA